MLPLAQSKRASFDPSDGLPLVDEDQAYAGARSARASLLPLLEGSRAAVAIAFHAMQRPGNRRPDAPSCYRFRLDAAAPGDSPALPLVASNEQRGSPPEVSARCRCSSGASIGRRAYATLACVVRNDVACGGMRWVTVGHADQLGSSIVLSAPALDAGLTDDERRTRRHPS